MNRFKASAFLREETFFAQLLVSIVGFEVRCKQVANIFVEHDRVVVIVKMRFRFLS